MSNRLPIDTQSSDKDGSRNEHVADDGQGDRSADRVGDGPGFPSVTLSFAARATTIGVQGI